MKFLAVTLLAFFLQTSAGQEVEKVKVSVYYESLCPDSIRFINNQLTPTFLKIGNNLDLDLVPYGKAQTLEKNGTYVFECQHGPNECYGNKLQACAINENQSQSETLDFVNCVMASSNPADDKKVQACADSKGFSWDNIKSCADSALGPKLLAQLGVRTHDVDPIITFVPTIIFNDEFSSEDQSLSLRNFLDASCRKLKEKPDVCPLSRDDIPSWLY